jgi:hypothetical protein
MSDLAGRSCPLRYRYGAETIARLPAIEAETLYVAGGLYGNLPALAVIEAMAAAEPGPVSIVFNGDFNWFNVDDAGFAEINRHVLAHRAILGNVEAELGVAGDDAGCGCAYPDHVDSAVVERSNRIHALLKATAARHPLILDSLLPCRCTHALWSAIAASVSSMAMPIRWLAGVSTPKPWTTRTMRNG